MSDVKPSAAAPEPVAAASGTAAPNAAVPPKAPKPPNPALRMLGLPNLPKKLPSRNWLIFWTVTSAISGAIIYDKREKKRATARWAHAVEYLAKEPISNPLAMPRKLTIYISSPPGDGLRVAQDHFTEYVKPVLAASGLDWEFVQGRREGDVRAVVAERIRKARRGSEAPETTEPEEDKVPTSDEIIEMVRKQNNTPQYEGVRGDIVIGRHTWKEYIRGLHEGWLGPLTAPPEPEKLPEPPKEAAATEGDAPAEIDAAPKEEKKAEEEEPKPKVPPQPKPYNRIEDYATADLPLMIPAELTPAAPVREPHILGFLNTPTRLVRYFNRRKLADNIGREVASVCFNTYREFHEPETSAPEDAQYEQQKALEWEERDWVKTVWKEEKEVKKDDDAAAKVAEPPKEKIWAKPIVLDSRLATRMRRYELQSGDEERARGIVVPEEEIEGWTKGSLRSLWRWGAKKWAGEPKINIPLDDE